MNDQLRNTLSDLRLGSVLECCLEDAERGRQEAWSFEQYLLAVMSRELEERQNGRIERIRRESRLPGEKTLEAFETKRLPRKVSCQLSALLEGGFLDRCENVLAFGNPGSGKTHLLCALGHELINKGRKVLFTTCCHLVQDLLRAKQELRLEGHLKRLRRYEALIIDDIGYVQHDREEMEVLFTLLADRYERASILLTSNLPFSKWEKIFKDPMTTAAAIDRLVHHSIILEVNVKSYRMEQAGNTREKEEP
jgi:DNA replication protein DnaC